LNLDVILMVRTTKLMEWLRTLSTRGKKKPCNVRPSIHKTENLCLRDCRLKGNYIGDMIRSFHSQGRSNGFEEVLFQERKVKNQSSLWRRGADCILLQVNLRPFKGISIMPKLLNCFSWRRLVSIHMRSDEIKISNNETINITRNVNIAEPR
jgi:hypothetical protein